MRIKENYVLQQVADEHIVIPVGAEADHLHGVIRMNQTGTILWNELVSGVHDKEELVKALVSEYVVDESTAQKDVDSFLNQLFSMGCIQE